MKTAISIPDPLFQEAEQFAQENGLSRSELYARALQVYLAHHRPQAITQALNEIYDQEDSRIEPGFLAAQVTLLQKEDW
jgi:metal-responsive CopG/Arc/MetJ family transcriptional regulator